MKDLGKDAKDLLGKNYNFGENKVELASKANDVSFETEWSSKGDAKFQTEFSTPNNTSVKVECLASNQVTGTFKAKDVVEGATLTLKAATTNKFFAGVEYTQGVAAVTTDLEYDTRSGPVFNASALLSQGKFRAGGAAKFAPQGNGLSEYKVGGGYVEDKTFGVYAHVSESFDKPAPPQLLLQYIHFAKPDTTLGAKLTRSLDDTAKTGVEIGGTYQLNSDTKVGAKIDNGARLGVYALYSLNRDVTLTQSLQLDVRDPSAPHKAGFGIKFKH